MPHTSTALEAKGRRTDQFADRTGAARSKACNALQLAGWGEETDEDVRSPHVAEVLILRDQRQRLGQRHRLHRVAIERSFAGPRRGAAPASPFDIWWMVAVSAAMVAFAWARAADRADCGQLIARPQRRARVLCACCR
jgi:hypothetical protein